MALLWKNLVKKSISNTRSSFFIPKRDPIFNSTATGEKYSSSNRFLLRRLRASGLDESVHFCDNSQKPWISSITVCEDFWNSDYIMFCCRATSQFSEISLSREKDFLSTIQHSFPSFHEYRCVGSCRGLVCFDDFNQGAILWNPSTNQTKLLPPSDLDRPNPTEVVESFWIYSTRSGFGFDLKSQSHKYVRWIRVIVREDEDDPGADDLYEFVEVYCLKSDSWTLTSHPGGYGQMETSAACVNGDFYWISNWINPTEILKYDFAAQHFSYLPFPHTGKHIDGQTRVDYPVSDGAYDFKLCDFGGSLGVIVYSTKTEQTAFELWVWKGWCWVKEFDHVLPAERPLGFSRTGEFMFLVGSKRQLVVYNVATKELKHQFDIYCNTHVFDLIPYFEEINFPLNNPNSITNTEEEKCAAKLLL